MNNLQNEQKTKNDQVSEEKNFEEAFARLEQILELMNSGKLSLDESLKLYEEADKLILVCNRRLTDAERRVEILIKNRNGELALGPDGKPQTEEFRLPPGK